MDKKEQNSYPKGHFPVHISVTGKSMHGDALSLLEKFVEQAGEKYPLAILEKPSGEATKAEATISVPFPDRENIRIDFNIFASDMEETCGKDPHFYMGSAL